VKDHTVRERGNRIPCRNDINQDRLTVDDPPQGFAVGLIDAVQALAFCGASVLQLCEKAGKASIPACRRRPLHMNNLSTLTRKVLGKQLKPDIDDARRRRQQAVWLAAILVLLWVHLVPSSGPDYDRARHTKTIGRKP
jgi:hypothetical protein